MKLRKKMKNKIFKNTINIGLPAFILGFGLNYLFHNLNNSPNEELEKTLKMAEHLEKLTNYKPLKNQEIDLIFPFLNSGLKEYLDKIYIIEPKDLGNIGGHKHGNIICLPKGFPEFAVYHEATHIRKDALDNLGLDFSKKWKNLTNFIYEDNNYFLYGNENPEGAKWREDSTEIPKNGLLTPYSAKSIGEDVSEFVRISMNCFSKNFLNREDIGYIFADTKTDKKILEEYAESFPLYFADTTDHRYQKKLDLLKEYNFLTNEEHERLSRDLGSLNYLLKEKKNELHK